MFAPKFLVFLSLSTQASDNSALNCCLRVVLYVPVASVRHKVLYLITAQGRSVCLSFLFERTNDGGRLSGLICPRSEIRLVSYLACCMRRPYQSVLSEMKMNHCPRMSLCVRECMCRCGCRCVHSAASVMSPRWAVTINPYLRRKQVSSPEEAIILQPG